MKREEEEIRSEIEMVSIVGLNAHLASRGLDSLLALVLMIVILTEYAMQLHFVVFVLLTKVGSQERGKWSKPVQFNYKLFKFFWYDNNNKI